ncbi:hypothetical protein NPIL_167351 [Nephila pilipes]|uniref:Uncharacterized protein n=1 Tax=Nephila pilipes TaxID=299642 RepID=A0A8X6MRJ4_NEPPI|nr:hypothetical protein NPIL_167351 [Nephila pilipes]
MSTHYRDNTLELSVLGNSRSANIRRCYTCTLSVDRYLLTTDLMDGSIKPKISIPIAESLLVSDSAERRLMETCRGFSVYTMDLTLLHMRRVMGNVAMDLKKVSSDQDDTCSFGESHLQMLLSHGIQR